MARLKTIHLTWPDGATAVVIMHFAESRVTGLTITGAKRRLRRLQGVTEVGSFTTDLDEIVREQNVRVITRDAA